MSWRGGQTSHRGGDNQGRKEVYDLLKTSGATNKVFKAVPVGDYPDAVAISPFTIMVFVAASGPDNITVINTSASG